MIRTHTQAIAALLVTAALASCSAPAPAARPGGIPARSPDRAASATLPPQEEALCKVTPLEGCRVAQVDGHDYRYYEAPPLARSDGVGLLVDVGGPGISLAGVLTQNWADQLRKDLGVIAANKTLILIDEPWTTGSVDQKCSVSSARFYLAARTQWRSPVPTGVSAPDCPWGQGRYGWSPASYRQVLTTIRKREGVRVLDMAALSFGAVRYTYVSDLVRTAILVRPAAPPGTKNAAVLHARVQQAWKALAGQCDGCTATNVRDRASSLLTRYAHASTDLSWRSVPVTDFDVASALVAAAIRGGSKPSLAWQGSSVDMDSAGRLSDALWLRVGEHGLSPAMIAYVDEYCRAYGPGPARGPFDPIDYILGLPTRCADSPPARRVSIRPVACVIAGADDVSAPAALAATWPVRRSARTVSHAGRHWFTDINRCAIGG